MYAPRATPMDWGTRHLPVGSVLIWILLNQSVAFNLLRIHSERVMLFADAAFENFSTSSSDKRTGTILALAFPFGSGGLPGFLDFWF